VKPPKVIVAPEAEPITTEEARAHLEAPAYEDSDVDPIDDTMIEGWLGAAREMCEQFLGLSLATQTLEIALDAWPTVAADGTTAINLPMGPVRQILQIMTPAVDGFTSDDVDSDSAADVAVFADGEVNPDQYSLDDYSKPERAYPITSWPTITAATNAIKIRYLAGYGVESDGGEAMPRAARAAILVTLAHLYAHRGDEDAQLPPTAEALLRPLRVRLGMA
jgi:uncharacterized phiE125 gp8 family phage protein